MKRLMLVLLVSLFLTPISLVAQAPDFNKEQLALRTDLFNFLKEEGFMPEIDSDGDIKFKQEGQTYYFTISESDTNPMYVVLFRIFEYSDGITPEILTLASRELNLYKGVKVLCFDYSFRVGAELFVRDAEIIKSTFYKLIKIISDVTSLVVEECENVEKSSSYSSSSSSVSEIPFIITKMEVANSDKNGKIIQDYGTTIWDFKTNYLQPRLTIKPYRKSGSYTVYVKFYNKDGVLTTSSSSPKGYSYSATITLNGSSSQTVELSGWGSDTAGHWPMGDYRFEIWYGDYCIGSKIFSVK